MLDRAGIGGNGGNVLYRRAVLERVRRRDGSIWNERLPTGEDIELIGRLRASGARSVWSPVRVRRLRRDTLLGHLRHQYRGALNAPSGPRWGRLLLDQLRGPFCPGDFGTPGRSLAFWRGQKAHIAGYLAARLERRQRSDPPSCGSA